MGSALSALLLLRLAQLKTMPLGGRPGHAVGSQEEIKQYLEAKRSLPQGCTGVEQVASLFLLRVTAMLRVWVLALPGAC